MGRGVLLSILALVLIVLVWRRPSMGRERMGKVLIFLALFILPLTATILGLGAHLDHSKSTEFCLSCHVMEPYGKSLALADQEYLPAAHFQNKRVPQDKACFACHTQYTMYGDFNAKLRGLKHVYVQYLGTVPDKVELYSPYNNRECLYCHGGARSFEESDVHEGMEEEFAENEISCLECHDMTHAVDEVEELDLWEPLIK